MGSNPMNNRKNKRAVLALTATQALSLPIAAFYLPVHVTISLGFSGAELGLALSVYAATALLAALPVGVSADRMSPRRLLATGLLFHATGAVGLALSTTLATVLVSFVAFGVSVNLFRQVLDAVWYRGGDCDNTDVAARFGPFLAARWAGMATGLMVGGIAYHLLGFPITMLAAASLVVPMSGLALLTPAVPLASSSIRDYVRDLANPRVLFFALWIFLYTSHWGAETTHYGLFLRNNLELDLPWMGAYMAGEFLTLGLATWLAGRTRAAREGSVKLAALGLALSGITHVAMTWPEPWISFLFRMIHGAGDGILTVVIYASVGRLFRLERIGGLAGVIMLVTMLASATGALVYGPMGEAWGHGAPLVTSGLLTVLLIPLLIVGRHLSKTS